MHSPVGFWCSEGNKVPCGNGTYQPNLRGIDMGDCMACPEHSTTLGVAATSLGACLCNDGWYAIEDAAGRLRCAACPLPGTACDTRGITLAELPLAPLYWRSSNTSTDPRRCPTFARVAAERRCLGGRDTCAPATWHPWLQQQFVHPRRFKASSAGRD